MCWRLPMSTAREPGRKWRSIRARQARSVAASATLPALAVDGSGNVYVADWGNSAVKEIPPGCTASSCVTTLGGGFGTPSGVAVDGSGNVYVADSGNNAVKEMPPGCASSSCVTTLGGGFSDPAGVAVDGSGNVYVADWGNSAVKEMLPGCTASNYNNGNCTITTLGGGFSTPSGVAVDGVGNVYVADTGNSAVKEMTPGCTAFSYSNGTCTITTLGGGFSQPSGRGGGRRRQCLCRRFRQQRGETRCRRTAPPPVTTAALAPSTTLGNGFSYPEGVALDGGGNVYVADSGNNAVNEINRSNAAQPELCRDQRGDRKQRQPADGDARQHRQCGADVPGPQFRQQSFHLRRFPVGQLHHLPAGFRVVFRRHAGRERKLRAGSGLCSHRAGTDYRLAGADRQQPERRTAWLTPRRQSA